jgi:hypothetical protein
MIIFRRVFFGDLVKEGAGLLGDYLTGAFYQMM